MHYAYRNTTAFEGVDIYSGWKRVVDVLPVFESWFGAYPFPAEKYGHAEFTFGGGMEHQTMSSMGGSSLTLIAHELAHQWFGDLITMRRWPHLWLNEGFATYAELLYWQARPDLYPGAFEQRFDLYYHRALNASGTLVVEDTTSVSNLFNSSRVYAKGGMVLHMLRGLLGDSAFREVLLAYTQDEAVRYGTATTADFQRAAESISGESLDTFFRQWVTEGTGYPVYEVAWGYEAVGASYELTVTIEQTQEMPLSSVEVFEMPVTLALQTEGGEQRVHVFNDQRLQNYVFEVAARPVGVVFDPDRLILRDVTVRGVPVEATPEAPSHTRLAAIYPNPATSAIHVRFDLAEPAGVRLTLRDVLGRRVRVLMDRPLQAGTYEETFTVSDIAPSVYLLRLDAGDHHITGPVAIVR